MARRIFVRESKPKSKEAIEQSLLRHKLAFAAGIYSGVYDELCPAVEVGGPLVESKFTQFNN